MAKVIDGEGKKFLFTFEQIECVNSETVMQLFDKSNVTAVATGC